MLPISPFAQSNYILTISLFDANASPSDQLTVSGGGSASPGTVLIPGMYAATDPGILVDIHASLSTYIDPGPTVYSGGTTKSAGATCSSLVEAQTTTGTSFIQTNTHASSSATGTGSSGGCTAAKYAQCGGTGWTGCKICAVCCTFLLNGVFADKFYL
jgi:cellulase